MPKQVLLLLLFVYALLVACESDTNVAQEKANSAPVITSDALTSATQDIVYSYFLVATATEGSALSYEDVSVPILPAWLSFSPVTRILSGTPSNSDVGTVDVTLSVSDGVAPAVEESFTITVVNVNDAPVITSIGLVDATQNVPYNYTLTATDPDGDTLLYEEVSIPLWLTFTPVTQTLSGVPLSGDIGDVNVILNVSDGIAQPVQESFTITVFPVLDAPSNLKVQAGMPTLAMTWDVVADVQQYNLYASTLTGISPDNWSVMPDGQVILDVTSPYPYNRIYKDSTYYFVVTAVVDNEESLPSNEAEDTNQYVFDDFERPNQSLGGTTPTAQVWVAGGQGFSTYGISNGKMVTTNNVYPSLPYVQNNFRFGSTFSFTSDVNDVGSIVLIAGADTNGGGDGRSLRNMVHLQLQETGWGLIYRADLHESYVASVGQTIFDFPFKISSAQTLLVSVNGERVTISDYVVSAIGNSSGGVITFNNPMIGGETVDIYEAGEFENISGGVYSLAAEVLHNSAMTILGDTVTLELPDGTTQQFTDSRMQTLSGDTLLWQLTGPNFRNESVFATPVNN